MILVVKKWARHNQINDASKGTLSSYTLVLMVLHSLQSQYNLTHRQNLFFNSHLTYFESRHIRVVFFTALSDPVLPSLQRDYPVSVSISFATESCLHYQFSFYFLPSHPGIE